MIIFMRHFRHPDEVHCAWGIRRFFNQHGLDLKKFREEGISEEELRSTGDIRVERVIQKAYDE